MRCFSCVLCLIVLFCALFVLLEILQGKKLSIAFERFVVENTTVVLLLPYRVRRCPRDAGFFANSAHLSYVATYSLRNTWQHFHCGIRSNSLSRMSAEYVATYSHTSWILCTLPSVHNLHILGTGHTLRTQI